MDTRTSYLQKLSGLNLLVPQAQSAPKHQTLIVFNWDDTLLSACGCSLSCQKLRHADLEPSVVRHFEQIQQKMKRLLELAANRGPILIITDGIARKKPSRYLSSRHPDNAYHNWLQDYAWRWIEVVFDVLKNQNVRVIPARPEWGRRHWNLYGEDQVREWKFQALFALKPELNSQVVTNIVSVGGSNVEMDAAHAMGKEFAQACVKVITFGEKPSPERLLEQLELLTEKFERIIEAGENLTMTSAQLVDW